MYLLLIGIAFADPPGLKGHGPITIAPCGGRPCTEIVSDGSPGIVPTYTLVAIGQEGREDLNWAPVTLTFAGAEFTGYLISPMDRSGDLDTASGMWFYGETFLDSDSTLDVVAGPVDFVPGESFTTTLGVMMDARDTTWVPTHELTVSATLGTGGSEAATVYAWTLDEVLLSDSATGGTVYHDATRAPVDIDLSITGIHYQMTQDTNASNAVVVVSEAIAWTYSTFVYSGHSLGTVGAFTSYRADSISAADGSDTSTLSSSARSTQREFASATTEAAAAAGVVTQAITSTVGTARRATTTKTEVNTTDGVSSSTRSGKGTSTSHTRLAAAGVSTSDVFTEMAGKIGDL